MNPGIPKQIVRFISKHHVLTLATVMDNMPWCCNLFYAFIPEQHMLVFTSDPNTRHIQEALLQQHIAGSVVLETSIVGKIRGIQFEGILIKPVEMQSKEFRSSYLKRFPYAVFTNHEMWGLELQYIKFTDNRLGFGKKIIWDKNQSESSVL